MIRRFTRCFAITIACASLMEDANAQWMPRVELKPDSSLDWEFASSRAEPWVTPEHARDGTRASAPSCEISVPASYDAKKPVAVLLYLSPGPQPQAFRVWKSVLHRRRILFVSPHNVGNQVAAEKRIGRAILSLDHVRRNYNVNPDRTYIAGFSGGARIAKQIAYSYPELFGGMIQLGSGGRLPSEDWLIDRIVARLSVALITGNEDGFQPEVEHSTYVTLHETGVRTRLWLPRIGHKLPAARLMDEAIRWLEKGVEDRRALADEFPATRMADSPKQEVIAQRFLSEATKRTAQPEHLRHGVLMLQGISERWPKTAAGKVARDKFDELKQETDRAWQNEHRRVRLHRLVAIAKGNEAFATVKTLHHFEAQRPMLLRSAIEAWRAVHLLAVDNDMRAEAVAGLERLSVPIE